MTVAVEDRGGDWVSGRERQGEERVDFSGGYGGQERRLGLGERETRGGERISVILFFFSQF